MAQKRKQPTRAELDRREAELAKRVLEIFGIRHTPPMLTDRELLFAFAGADFIRSHNGRPWHLSWLN